MKILIGYDGSEYADAAVMDLLRSGLPPAARAVLISMPAPSTSCGDTRSSSPGNAAAPDSAGAEEDVAVVARRGSDLVRHCFPNWELSVDLGIGSAVSVVTKKASQWKPDLIVLGLQAESRNQNRFSAISRRIANQATCSVRMARGFQVGADEAPRILLCVDGSPHSKAAAQAVASREWPKGTEVRIFTVVNPFDYSIPELLDRAVARAKGFHRIIASEVDCTPAFTSSAVREGEPEKVIIREAHEWRADSIFLAPRDGYRFDRLIGAGVCATVIAQAKCAVELARATPDSVGVDSFQASPAASPIFE